MKKKRFYSVLALLIIASFLIVTMNNCRKPKHEVINNENQTDYEALIEKSKAMQGHILAFKAKMEYYRDNPDLKTGGEFYTADSAVLEIESLINYDSCFASIECNQKTFEISEITLPLDDIEKINDPDLMQVYYDKVMDTIQAQMDRVNYSNMKLLLVDLENTGTNSNGDAIISVGTLIGRGVVPSLYDDNWWYGEYGGLCGTGQYAPEDGASQLDYKVTKVMLPDPPSGANWWFRNITSTYIIPTSDPLNQPPTNYLDYKIFYATTAGGLVINYDVKCMSYYEMDFYKNHYVDYAQAEESTNRKFARCWIHGNNYSLPEYHIQHDYTIFVGERFIIWHE